ncbi:hypothetical protein F511_40861 [Dorcoceras hygrometricum]|uniref:Uncharacterized protein n=1 Tax=Dorcoceras hygrometricum TaxID=472368 RepID=A0A2Z7DH28_9LAMI|nr:hypothetical protein F511_40861 [Dorcoceras hygrometricum]
MEHTRMTRMIKSLEDTGLRGFLEGTTFVFENAVTELFVNAKVIAGISLVLCVIKSWTLQEDMFSTTFKLPTDGMTGLGYIPKETIVEMRSRFSATDVPFRAPSKKREMWIEYRLLHDIVAKSLCAKVGSFDTVTCEKFEFMVAISLEDTGLKGFLEASDLVYEGAVIELITNTKVITGTIVSSMGNRKIALTKDVFTEVFRLPTEGLTDLTDIPKEIVAEMRSLLSGSDEPLFTPSKKKGMNMEIRFLHDIVAKALCTKAGSFDMVTNEKFNFMIAITARLKVNWSQILFQVLLSMLNKPKRKSQGFVVHVSVLLERMVKSDLGDSIKLHPQKVLTNKSVLTYIKKNQEKPTGETSKLTEDTASNTDGEERYSVEDNLVTGLGEHERMDFDQDEQRGGDDRIEINLEYDTQMAHGDWVNKDDRIETEESTSRHKQMSDRAIVVMSKKPALHTMTSLQQGILSPVHIQKIDWLTYFLPKINPASKGKKTLVVVTLRSD